MFISIPTAHEAQSEYWYESVLKKQQSVAREAQFYIDFKTSQGYLTR